MDVKELFEQSPRQQTEEELTWKAPLGLHQRATSLKSLRKGVKECPQSSAEQQLIFIGHDATHSISEPKPL